MTNKASHLPAYFDSTHLPGVIRRVQAIETTHVVDHLMRLEPSLRRRRFAHDVCDAHLKRYAESVASNGDLAFGYFENGRIHALGELRRQGLSWGIPAEAAFTVESAYANKGLATQLMGLIIRAARNRGVRHLYLYFDADNAKMQAISRHYGAELSFEDGSVIADIAPPLANYQSLGGEVIDDRISRMQSLIDMQINWIELLTGKDMSENRK